MSGAHQTLVAFSYGFQQQLLASWIQFSQNIVQQQQGWGPNDRGDKFQLGQFEGKHQGALLSG
jgi:hypothetical protein